jgi:hypothetical protein
MTVYLKPMAWVGSFATLFFFLPSLGKRLWEALATAPWRYQRWVFYLLLAGTIFAFARRRIAERKIETANLADQSLMDILKQRLVKGEIGLEEFRIIRQEIQNYDEY